ncbi:MAG: MOSC domain-containing protein [Armatimonadetes bacterium]|nr:MOSC domain-containing protein [Armatimonadota bacterium]
MDPGQIIGVNLSTRKGTKKTNVGAGYLIADHGLQGDAHAGTDRQVSLFPAERAEELAAGLGLVVQPGDFAENITVRGLNLKKVEPGARLLVGEAIVEVTRIGKQDGEFHTFSFHGLAPLRTEGIFCRVVKSGRVKEGDRVSLIE